MTIILFLVDTSASMCQKAYINGVQKTYLDIAKGAVETFLKYRQRSADCMGDRYMLLTFEDPPCNVKAGWKENHSTFMNELKNLQSNGLTSMGEALRNAFDLLNLNRMQSGIDTYGQGRCPFYLEPSVIIVITDGGKYSFKTGVQQEIILPLNTQTTGAKLTKEPFRWDQRLFSLVLRMPGNRLRPDELRPEGKVPHDDSPIEKMCEVTGGRSYRVRSHHVLNQCIESLVQKVQPGVVVHFEAPMPTSLQQQQPPHIMQQQQQQQHMQSINGAPVIVGGGGGGPLSNVPPSAVAVEMPDLAFGATKKMIYVQKHPTQKTFPVGFWPIPEPYWPDNKATSLPAREAHPRFRICTPCVEEPPLVRNFPVDKYEVEPSPLTLQILCRREPTKCWPVFIANGCHGLELPFGYLKASATFAQVHLVILPYNYLTLLPLLNDLFHKFGLNPPSEWMFKFTAYLRSIPQYYGPFLRRALAAALVPFQLLQYILPDNLDSYLSPAMATYLKTMKNNAKQEQENMCLRVFKQLKLPRPPYHQPEVAKLNCGQPLRRELCTHPQLRDTFAKMHAEISQFEAYNITVPAVQVQPPAKSYRNPFDVPRRELIEAITHMRENFMRLPTHGIAIYTKDAGHSLPIADMGNYQEYLKNKQQPLREIEPTNVRQHMFGNPYKKDKHMVMVDEADVVGEGSSQQQQQQQQQSAQQQQASTSTPPPGMNKIGPPGSPHHQQQMQMQQHQQQQQQQQQHQHQQMHQQHMLMMQQQQQQHQQHMQLKKDMAAARPRKRKAGPIHRDYVFKRRAGSDRSSISSASSAFGSMPNSPRSVFSDSGDGGQTTDMDTDTDTDSESEAAFSDASSVGGSTNSNSRPISHHSSLTSANAAAGHDDDDNPALVIDLADDSDASSSQTSAAVENGHINGIGNGIPAVDNIKNIDRLGGTAKPDANNITPNDPNSAVDDDDDDDCRPVEPAGPPPPLPPGFFVATPHHLQQHHQNLHLQLQQQLQQLQQQQPSIIVAPSSLNVAPILSIAPSSTVIPTAIATTTNNNGHMSGTMTQPLPGVIGATTTPPSVSVPLLQHSASSAAHHHLLHLQPSTSTSSSTLSNGPPPNDFQAQEISKILQQCTTTNTNGKDSQSSVAASSSHHRGSGHHHHNHNSSSSSSSSSGVENSPSVNSSKSDSKLFSSLGSSSSNNHNHHARHKSPTTTATVRGRNAAASAGASNSTTTSNNSKQRSKPRQKTTTASKVRSRGRKSNSIGGNENESDGDDESNPSADERSDDDDDGDDNDDNENGTVAGGGSKKYQRNGTRTKVDNDNEDDENGDDDDENDDDDGVDDEDDSHNNHDSAKSKSSKRGGAKNGDSTGNRTAAATNRRRNAAGGKSNATKSSSSTAAEQRRRSNRKQTAAAAASARAAAAAAKRAAARSSDGSRSSASPSPSRSRSASPSASSTSSSSAEADGIASAASSDSDDGVADANAAVRQKSRHNGRKQQQQQAASVYDEQKQQQRRRRQQQQQQHRASNHDDTKPHNNHHSRDTSSHPADSDAENADTAAVAATAAAAVDESDEENSRENARLHNIDARQIIFRDIRRPGRDYSQLLDHLDLVRGSPQVRADFVQMCVDESMRFRRRKMADMIQAWWDDRQMEQLQRMVDEAERGADGGGMKSMSDTDRDGEPKRREPATVAKEKSTATVSDNHQRGQRRRR